MQITFEPRYTVTSAIVNNLLRIQAAKEQVKHLPLTPHVLASLRETARIYTTHYSTMIEGNKLEANQVLALVDEPNKFTARHRDEREVLGYYAALAYVEQYARTQEPLRENVIQKLHAYVMMGAHKRMKLAGYRDGQNVIKSRPSGAIVYLPPEAHDVPKLMRALVRWIDAAKSVPTPIVAGIAHYQFATIHPYYDGNGRTARLLATLILHRGGYDLKGLYSLEEYYAQNLPAYYSALTIGLSHNYYFGRAEADITPWLEYFIAGMAVAFERVIERMKDAQQSGALDQSGLLRMLDPRQREVLELFKRSRVVTARQIGDLFGLRSRASAKLCQQWVEKGFFAVVNTSNRARTYGLVKTYEDVVES